MRWPWQRKGEQPTAHYAPVASYLSPSLYVDLASLAVNERSALGISAVYRACSLISGTLASLPLRSFTGAGDDQRIVPSVFDDPDPEGQTAFEWKESAFVHLLLHGKAGAIKVRNAAGSVVGLPLVHPLAFVVSLPKRDENPVGGLWFDVQLQDGKHARLDADGFWYVPALSLMGQDGLGLLSLASQSLRTTMGGDRAAAKTFSNGALISGLATPADEGFDLTDDIPEIRRQLRNATEGTENAGTIALVNRRLQFTPWTMTAQQAQFLESRQFQIEEISRWTGVPPHLLMQTEKQTSWGTGVDEQNRGLSKFVLGHWAMRMEQRASRLLARPRWTEFDFAGLERPNFETNVKLVLDQIAAGLISPEYGRKLLNIPESAAPAEPETPEPAPAAAGEADDDPPAE